MTSLPAAVPRSRASAITATLMILVPLALVLVCVAARFDIIDLSQSVRAGLLFLLLLALMATGMPISIALGLSVLTYLFILSSVDPKMVGLKLFTSIDRFEIMAIPFFILAGNFLTSGGVARRMIDFATSMIGHWYGGLGLAGVVACALFAAISGSSVATVVGIGSVILPASAHEGHPPPVGAGVRAVRGDLGFVGRARRGHRLDHPAGDRAAGLSAAVRRRRDRDVRRARHPVPPADQPRHLRGGDERGEAAPPGRRDRRFRLGRPAVHRRPRARADARDHARH